MNNTADNAPRPQGMWPRVRLGDISEVVSKGTTPTSIGLAFAKQGVPFVRAEDVTGGAIETKSVSCHISPETDQALSRSRLRSGDLLITIAGTLGRVGYIADGAPPMNCNQAVAFARLNRQTADPQYVCLACRERGTINELLKLRAGSGVQNLNLEQVRALEIPLPPLPEQQRVAAILREQIAAIERARMAGDTRVAAARALQSSYLRRAFRGITPLAVNPYHTSQPTGWRWVDLIDIARLESGHTPSRNRSDWWGGAVPWIALPDIRKLDGKVAQDTLEHTNKQGIANSSARILPEGTVVLSRTASVGFVTIMGRPMATSQDFVNWVCGPDLDPHFLALLFRASREYIRSLASGAVHKTVYVPAVKKFQVCIPPLAEQQQIVATLQQQLASVGRARMGLQDQLDVINVLPAALLRRAFSGEL